MRVPALTFAAVGLIAAFLIAGCGGSGGTTTSQTPPLSKAAFIKAADAICEKADTVKYNQASAYRAKHEAELGRLSPVAAEEKLIRLFGLPAIKRQIEEVRALGAPEGEEKKVEGILNGLEKALDEAKKDPYAIEGEYESTNPFHRIDKAARNYGFSVCNNPA